MYMYTDLLLIEYEVCTARYGPSFYPSAKHMWLKCTGKNEDPYLVIHTKKKHQYSSQVCGKRSIWNMVHKLYKSQCMYCLRDIITCIIFKTRGRLPEFCRLLYNLYGAGCSCRSNHLVINELICHSPLLFQFLTPTLKHFKSLYMYWSICSTVQNDGNLSFKWCDCNNYLCPLYHFFQKLGKASKIVFIHVKWCIHV